MSSSRENTNAQNAAPVTPELLDELAAKLGVSEEARDAIDQTISALFASLSLASDTVVHKRGYATEHSDVPRPALPNDSLTPYIVARIIYRTMCEGEAVINVAPESGLEIS